MKCKLILGAFSLAAVIQLGNAQLESQSIPLPKDPLLPRAPQISVWSIEQNRSESNNNIDQAPEDDLKEKDGTITITKSGNIYREIITDSKHGSVVKWVIDGMQIKQSPNSSRLSRIPRTHFSSLYSDYRRSDFEPFEWISRDNYQGVEKYAGKFCYVFETTADKKNLTPREIADRLPEHEEDDLPGPPQPAITFKASDKRFTAYLDVTTQLPVALHEGGVITTYTFLPTPETKLQPPKEVLENIVAWRESINSRTPLPPKP